MGANVAFLSTMTSGAEPSLITGATGNVGREVLRALRLRGAAVRVARHRAAGGHGPEGVERARLDFEDPATFAPALKGCRSLFLMRPNPVLAVKKTLNRLLDVAADEGVRHCVFLSVAGAEKNSFVPHHAVEQHLMRGPLGWTMLRAAFFSQNLTGPYRDDIRAGVLVLPAGEARVAYVDAYDLGEVAAEALLHPGEHAGKAYHLTGPDSLSFQEIATLLSEELGRVVRYEAASILRYWRHCRRRGIGRVPTFAYTMIHATLRNGSGARTDPTLARLLGRPGRSVREFVATHRNVWA